MLMQPPHPSSMTPFFSPNGVAVIGASTDPSKLGHAVLRNLLDPASHYPGPVYPVNPKAEEVLGLRCYPDISAVPDPVELAVIIIPARSIPPIVEACGKRGIRAVIVISGGFREVGGEGISYEGQLIDIARQYQMRVMGPNGIGVIDTYTPLNTTFVRGMPARGDIAFLSQSGALCGAVIDWIIGRGIGFSRLLSVGNEADLNEADLLPCLAEDDHTQVITLYLEDVKDGKGFIAAAREAVARKPVLALKAGRTSGGQAATASHTGALAGAHTAFRAACRQTGVIECDTVKAMFDAATALSYQPPLKGKRIAILTNGGGPAALAADAMEPFGLVLARTSAATQAALRAILPSAAQVAGPVDMLGGARVHDYRLSLEALLGDGENDGVLVILAPQALVDPTEVVQALGDVSQQHPANKPLVLCLMGEASLGDAYGAAHWLRLPPFAFPDEAVAALGALYQRARTLATVRPDPVQPADMNLASAQSLLASAIQDGRRVLDAVAGQAVLRAANIAVPQDRLATTPDEAVEYAQQIGFPVALKLVSPDILHKTEVGGVLLAIQNEAAAREGFLELRKRSHAASAAAAFHGVQIQQMVRGGQEVIVGVKRDPTFGPLVMFGMGGIYAEALADVSFRLAPLSRMDAEEMLSEVRSARLLTGLRGAPPADREALIDTLLRVSWLARSCPAISELDINPLTVQPEGHGVCALDVRLVLQ